MVIKEYDYVFVNIMVILNNISYNRGG